MYRENYELWSSNEFFDSQTRAEVMSLKDEKEIEDRFYKNIEFGTGGMRGISGAGTNRINLYTVGRATLGLANYLISEYDNCKEAGVVIAYDTRHESRGLAERAAAVLTGMGIRVYIFDKAVPTPELSFAIKQLECAAGIVVTASHNPKEYNGYKVYDSNGCQLVPDQAKAVTKYINMIDDICDVDFCGNSSLISYIDMTENFVDTVCAEGVLSDEHAKKELKIVYTPIHGTGNIPVRKALEKSGFSKLYIVAEQEKPDGDFKTVRTPNPEDKAALSMGVELAKKEDADIVIGTDPDCDRVGVAVKTINGYEFLTGNQIGALLTEYIIDNSNMSGVKNPTVLKTVVSSELGADIAKAHGLKVISTLTGFKFIGEKITQFNECGDYTFVFGYEESYGYLKGDYVCDKDGVVSCLLICEMAALYKSQGMTLMDRLESIYQKYGYYYDSQENFTFIGKDGVEKMSSMMSALRSGSAHIDGVKKVIDYSKPVKCEENFGVLPTSNVLKFVYEDSSWVAVRPSGTEPKIKIYYSIKGKDRKISEKKFYNTKNDIKHALGIN